jgi:hypothetical protein
MVRDGRERICPSARKAAFMLGDRRALDFVGGGRKITFVLSPG